jgi:hypothetical protein
MGLIPKRATCWKILGKLGILHLLGSFGLFGSGQFLHGVRFAGIGGGAVADCSFNTTTNLPSLANR